MERDTITNYLKRAEFSIVQADALADILTEHASRSELRELRADFRRLEHNIDLRFDASDARAEDRFNAFAAAMEERSESFEMRMNERFESFEMRMNERFEAFEVTMNERFEAFEVTMNKRFDAFEAKMNERFATFTQITDSKLDGIEDRWTKALSQMEARLTWRLLALVTFMGTVMTLVGALLG